MKHLKGNYYVEVREKRYMIRTLEYIKLRKGVPPKSLGTEYKLQKETKSEKNRKVEKNNNELELKPFKPRKKRLKNSSKTKISIHQFAILVNKIFG